MAEEKDEKCCEYNFFDSMKQTIKNVIQDPRPVPESVKAERMAICEACEWKKGPKCGKCGCFLALKLKMNNVRCPLSEPKWIEHYE